MEQRYYIASLKNGAWFTGYGWSTDREQATDFNHMDALTKCKMFRANQHVVVPVLVDDMAWIDAV